MGRPNRIQMAGACYLVTLRGNNRQDIFLTNQDRRFFLSLLKKHKERYEFKVYAYCLMNNQAQILLETLRPNLALAMQAFCSVYTKQFNRRHNATGHLFEGRYQALVVDREAYLHEMTARVHLAPVLAGLAAKPWRYQWSSCPAYVESESKEPLVDSAEVLRRFAKSRLKQSVLYLHFIRERTQTPPDPPVPVHGGFIGRPEFVSSLSKVSAAKASGAASSTASKEKARLLISETLSGGISEDALFGRSRRGKIALVRKELVRRLRQEAKLGPTEIARMLHRTPSAVSQLIASMETTSRSV